MKINRLNSHKCVGLQQFQSCMFMIIYFMVYKNKRVGSVFKVPGENFQLNIQLTHLSKTRVHSLSSTNAG